MLVKRGNNLLLALSENNWV